MTNADYLPSISNLSAEELVVLRAAIDARIEEMRGALIEQAQRLGLAVSDAQPKKRRGRRPKAPDIPQEE